MEVKDIISNNLVQLRLHHNHTQSDLANLTDIDKGSISKYENNRIEAKSSTLSHIGECYRVNYRFFYVDSEDNFDMWLKMATDTYGKWDNITGIIDYLENY